MKKRAMKRFLGALMSFSMLLQPVVTTANQMKYGSVALASDETKVDVTTNEDATDNSRNGSSNDKKLRDSVEKKDNSSVSSSNRANDSPIAMGLDEDGNITYGIELEKESLSFDVLKAKTKTPDDVDFDDKDSIRAALSNPDFPFKPDEEWGAYAKSQGAKMNTWSEIDRDTAKWYREYYNMRLNLMNKAQGVAVYDGGHYTVKIDLHPVLSQTNDGVTWTGYTDRLGNYIPGGTRPGTELSWIYVGGGLVFCIQPERGLNTGNGVTGHRDLASKIGRQAAQDLAKIIYVTQGNRAGVSLTKGSISFERYIAGQILIWGYMKQGASLGEIQPGLTIAEWSNGAIDRVNAEINDIRAGIAALESNGGSLLIANSEYTVKPGQVLELNLNSYRNLSTSVSGIVESAQIIGDKVRIKIKDRDALGGAKIGTVTVDKDKDKYSIVERYQPDNASLQQTIWLQEFGDPDSAEVKFNLEDPRGSLKLKKVDDTGEAVPYAKFNVTGPDGYNKDVEVTNGEVTLDDLLAGDYTIREIEGHVNYVVNTESKTVTVTDGGFVTEEIVNKRLAGDFGIFKRNDLTNAGISGVKFKLTGNSVYNNEQVDRTETTDNQGKLTFRDLPLGTYNVTEETPAGYVTNGKTYTVKVFKANANDTTATVTVKDGNTDLTVNDGVLTVDNTPVRGNVKIIKKGSGNWLKNLYQAFLLEGAEFGIYDGQGKEVAKAKTNAQGVVEFNNLLGGKYTVKETFVPEGFRKIDDFEVTIAEHGKTVTIEKVDEVRKGKLRVVKVDKENNKPVNFAGAQFKIKNLQTNQFIQQDGKDTFDTNDKGEFTTKLDLLYGKYELVEVKAPVGYVLDTKPVKFSVTGDDTVVSLNFADIRVKGKVTVLKTGATPTKVAKSNGSYGTEYVLTMEQGRNLSGVEFDVIAKENITLKTGDVVKRAGEKVGTIVTNAQGQGQFEGLEIGKYILKETKAPAGYIFAKDTEFEITYEGETKALVTKGTTVANDFRQVKLILDKVEQKQVGLDTTTNKAHGVPKYENVPGAGKVFVVRTKDAIRDPKGQELVPAGGIMATLTTDGKGHVDKTLALPDGKYTVQEVKTTAGLILDQAVREFTVSSVGNNGIQEVNIAKLVLGGKTHFENNLNPIELKTTATNKDDGSKVLGATEDVTIVDRVQYKNLIVDGRSYTVSGKLMVRETGKPLQVNGKEVVASKTFVPTVSDGYVDLEFKFDASALGGNKVVAFEDLHQDKIHVGTHSDINDDGQTVTIPKFELKTTAVNAADNSKVFDPKEKVVLKDTVEYKGAVVGKEYTVTGTLVDTDGRPILENGKPVVGETKFKATATSGSVDVMFTFNAKSLRGKDVVVFEKAYVGVGVKPKLVGKHEDPKDKGQTVKVLDPKIETMASFNGRKVEDRLGQVTLRDVVKATNVIVGNDYELTADLMDPETEKPIVGKDGQKVTTKVKFKVGGENTYVVKEEPKLEKGQMYVVRDGKLIVVNEEGTLVKEVPVVNVKDLQKGTPVTMFTFADLNYDASILENKLKADEDLTYDDAKANKSLDLLGLAGKDLTLPKEKAEQPKEGTKPVDGKATTPSDKADGKDKPADKDKKVEAPKGIHVDKDGKVTYTGGDKAILDDLLKGVFNPSDLELDELVRKYKAKSIKTVVVYEGLSVDGQEIAFHRDPKDTDQQGYHNNIKLRTTFMDVKTNSHLIEVGGTVDLVDKVAVYNVINGNEYEVTGTIHDRNTGKPLTKENGDVYTNTVKVKVNVDGAKQGEVVNTVVDVPFTVNVADIKTSHIVAFEEIKRAGGIDVLAIHKDVNDKYQTIEKTTPEVGTKFADVKDSQEILPMEKVKVIDHVSLKNVVNGKKYEVTGTIMDKATGKQLVDANGKPYESKVTVEVKDKDKPEGARVDTTVEVEFEIDASKLAGKEIVAFEELRKAGDPEVIGSHKDINDKGQTIKVNKPVLKTKATVDGKKEVTIDGDVTIEDVISYSGLKVGVEYTFTGKLMDAKTKQPLKVDGKEVVAETKVTPAKESGTAKVTFKFNAKGLDTTKVVVFEKALAYNELTKKPNVIGTHEDFNDKDQTVDLVKKRLPNTSLSDMFTDYSGYGLVVLVISGLGLVVIRRRKAE
jgi:collagen adhesion protein